VVVVVVVVVADTAAIATDRTTRGIFAS
jgi:hypothetical protein